MITKTCYKCGYVNKPDCSSCINCYAMLDINQSEINNKRANKRYPKVFIIVIGILFLGAGLFALSKTMSKQNVSQLINTKPQIDIEYEVTNEFIKDEKSVYYDKTYRSDDKLRKEAYDFNDRLITISIYRNDIGKAWFINPITNVYKESKLTKIPDLSNENIISSIKSRYPKLKPVGADVILGRNCIRYFDDTELMENMKSTYEIWFDPTIQLIMKEKSIETASFQSLYEKTNKSITKTNGWEITSLKIGKQNSKLFELPKNLKKISEEEYNASRNRRKLSFSN